MLIVDLYMRNNGVIRVETNHVTIEGFAEDLVSIKTYGDAKTSISKYGDFIAIGLDFIKYDDIVNFKEVWEDKK